MKSLKDYTRTRRAPEYTNGKLNRNGWNRRRRLPDIRVDDLGIKDGNVTHDPVEEASPAEELESEK